MICDLFHRLENGKLGDFLERKTTEVMHCPFKNLRFVIARRLLPKQSQYGSPPEIASPRLAARNDRASAFSFSV
jgi:hypothetical protein